jgi:hypothetical protein
MKFMRSTRLGWLFTVPLSAVLVGCGDSRLSLPAPQPNVVAELRAGDAEAAAETGATETAATGTGWATIKGRFVFEGTAPAPGVLPTGGKDAPTCNPNGIPDESLVVDPNGGIRDVLIFARKVSRVNDEYASAAGEPTEFDQKNCMFLSHVKPVLVGQPVLLKNSEASVGHNTSISPPGDRAANPLIPPGSEDTYKFGRAQNVPVAVTCSIHPWMKAYIIPRDNPYFAVTGPDGQFEIKDVPAGEEVEFQVWQESAAGPQGSLIIPGLTDNRGRIVKKLAADETVDLGEIKVPAAAFKK